jgi:hypothetical protein
MSKSIDGWNRPDAMHCDGGVRSCMVIEIKSSSSTAELAKGERHDVESP